jgi:hypothetical protein
MLYCSRDSCKGKKHRVNKYGSWISSGKRYQEYICTVCLLPVFRPLDEEGNQIDKVPYVKEVKDELH